MKRIEKRGKELLERKKIEGKNCLKLLNGKKKCVLAHQNGNSPGIP